MPIGARAAIDRGAAFVFIRRNADVGFKLFRVEMLRKPSRDAHDMRREQQTDAFNLKNRAGRLRDPDVLRDGGLEFGVSAWSRIARRQSRKPDGAFRKTRP